MSQKKKKNVQELRFIFSDHAECRYFYETGFQIQKLYLVKKKPTQ